MKRPARGMEAARDGEAELKPRKEEEPVQEMAAEQGWEREWGVEQEQEPRFPGEFQVRMTDWFLP